MPPVIRCPRNLRGFLVERPRAHCNTAMKDPLHALNPVDEMTVLISGGRISVASGWVGAAIFAAALILRSARQHSPLPLNAHSSTHPAAAAIPGQPASQGARTVLLDLLTQSPLILQLFPSPRVDRKRLPTARSKSFSLNTHLVRCGNRYNSTR